ncbi:hypothetical protein O181_050584 [Austropuccinia psidii MF-1]|uniref:Uncharacterized protein n=1 Tax=Austropuccinia psidii MF-1 TaxID=1389203 RepID=A0A9Q3DX44_9BASI|nr:hypothetical protein [Austropuccinia psidii MF-1]
MQAFPFLVTAFAATELQFCPPALKLRLLQVLQLLRLSQLHHGIKDHLHTTSPSNSFSPTPLCSRSPAVVLLNFRTFGLERLYLVSALNLSNSLCCALYAPSGLSPAFVPQQRPLLVMLADKHTRDRLGPKQADGNDSGGLALSPQVSICPPPLLGHHLMVTSLLDLSEVIIRPMKDGDGERTFELGPIVTMSCHQWDSNTKNKTPQIPPNKTLPFPVCLASKPCGNSLQARVAPDEPPIPGLSPSSQPPEDNTTREPEPDVAPTQSTEEPFACPATPRSIISSSHRP